jgi:hypothetical protein
MKIVSQKTIDKTLASMDKMGEEEVAALVQSFADEQPAIMTFILAQEEEFTDDDFDSLIDLTLMIFLCFKNECGRVRSVGIEEVETFADKQMEHLERMEMMTESELEAEMAATIDRAKQPFLLEYITEELAVREEEGSIDDPSGGAYFFPHLQLVIDLLDAAANGSFLKIV